MSDFAAEIARIKGRWMIGGAALGQAPADWQAVAAHDAEPELGLLAITGQATQLLYRPSPAGTIAPPRRLPRLALPVLPDALRARFRTLVRILKPTDPMMAMIVHLMAARGHAVHPVDWMPGSVDDLPGIYAPWSDWQARTGDEVPPEGLSAETWDDWMPAERRLALQALRRSDPDRALALIEQHAQGLAAEQRLRLFECLEIGLNPSDTAFLTALGADRSGKVRTLAAQLLARLGTPGNAGAGTGAGTGAGAEELAGFFTIASAGILRRGRVISANRLKTQAQRTRRTELFATVPLAAFAAALGLDVRQTVEMWTDRDPTTLPDFADMVARTGPDDILQEAVGRLLEFKDTQTVILTGIVRRLPPGAHRRHVAALIARDVPGLSAAAVCLRDSLGTVSLAEIEASGALKPIGEAVLDYAAAETRRADPAMQASLAHLGLLADAQAAQSLIERFTAMGLIGADPALAMLTFNAALTGDHQ